MRVKRRDKIERERERRDQEKLKTKYFEREVGEREREMYLLRGDVFWDDASCCFERTEGLK